MELKLSDQQLLWLCIFTITTYHIGPKWLYYGCIGLFGIFGTLFLVALIGALANLIEGLLFRPDR